MVLDKEEDGRDIPASRYAFSVDPIFGSTEFVMNAISTGRIFRPVEVLDAVKLFFIYQFSGAVKQK